MAGKFEGEFITDENRERVAALTAGLLTQPNFDTPQPQTFQEEVPIELPRTSLPMPTPIRLPFEIPWRIRDPQNRIEARVKRSQTQQKDLLAVAGFATTMFFLYISGNQMIKHAFPTNPTPIERPTRDPGGNAIYDRLEEIQAPQRQINRIPR